MDTGKAVLAAVRENDLAGLKRLLADNAALAAARGDDGISAVMLARYLARTEALQLLLAAAPVLDLFEAAATGATDRLTALLEANPGCVAGWSVDGFTALHLAAFFGSTACALLLLERGADPNTVATNGTELRPLHSAAAARDYTICEALLQRGADVNARQQGGFTVLHAAAQHGDDRLATLLLAHGADPALRTDDGRDAATLAAEHGHEALAGRLGAPRAGSAAPGS